MRANEIAFIPHNDRAGWCQDFNRTFRRIFREPPIGFTGNERDIGENRRKQHAALYRLVPWIRKNGIKGVFFCNITKDFYHEILPLAGVRKIWGITPQPRAGTANIRKDRLIAYENGVYDAVDTVFVASRTTNRSIGGRGKVVGFPIYTPPEPHGERDDGILFNHRLDPVKTPDALLTFPEHLLDRVTISTTTRPLPKHSRVLSSVATYRVDPQPNEYLHLLRTSRYEVSFSKREDFGYAVYEALARGAFPLCPATEECSFVEYLPSEMLFSTPAEVPEMIAYYDERPEERERLVAQAQEGLRYLNISTWLDNLLSEMGVEV